MKKPLLLSLLGGLALCAATPAFAQSEPPPPPANTPPPNAAPVTSAGGGAIGIGAVEWLGQTGNGATPVTGAQFVYDQPIFHIEGVFGYDHASVNGASASQVRFGAAGWYHLARGTNADFSIGGGAGLVYTSAMGAGGSQTGFTLEPGAEARVFLTPNFALSCRVGFAITFADNNGPTTFSLSGETAGALGFTYFFR